MLELKAKGEEKGEDEFDKRLAVVKELKVGPFIVEIDGDGAVLASLAGRLSHGSSSGQMVSTADDPRWRNTCTIARGSRRERPATTKSDGMWKFEFRPVCSGVLEGVVDRKPLGRCCHKKSVVCRHEHRH
jgi:hypothetical protein